jgi:hypothetical protein
MAGTVVTTEVTHGSVKQITFAWTSAAGGQADATTTRLYTGRIEAIVFTPGTGPTQPSDAYDVLLLDGNSLDVLAGNGADVSNAAPVVKVPGTATAPGAVVGSALTLGITNGGDAKTGSIAVFIR